MWEKVVLNLLSNALKYTPDGSIGVRLGLDGDRVALTISDTGVGVPEADLPLLFERFHRVRGVAGRSHEGAGVGLALADELVRLHGGSIGARSVEGRGSTFTVSLPFASRHPGRRPAVLPPGRGELGAVYLEEALQWTAPAGDEPTVATGAAADATVLVVEDNADLRRFMSGLLQDEWRVLEAADGNAGLAVAREQRPDLVLTDVMMPGLDGFALLRALRGDPATAAIPVVFLSARAGEDAAIEGLDAGADDYLPKPFSARELLARVRSNLELARFRNREADFREALVAVLHEGVALLDAEATVIEVNDAFAATTGFGRDGLPYPYPYPWSLGADDPQAREEAALAQFLDAREGEFLVPIRHREGHRLWVATSVKAVPDSPGHEGLSVASTRDVTLQRETAERDAVVAEFVSALPAAGDTRELLDTALSALRVLFHAGRAAVVLWSEERPETVVGDALADDALAALDGVRRRGTPAVTEFAFPADPSVTSALAVALDSDAGLWLELAAARPVTDRERVLLGLVASHLGTALTRARSFTQARDVALTLQQAILGPTLLPHGFAARYQPAVQPLEVGGDWYDVVELGGQLGGQLVGLVVGDCVGRGLPAAAVMGQLRSACQALLLRTASPGRVLSGLDAFAARLPGASCTTALVAVLDRASGHMRYSCAGHPPPLLAHPDGTTEELDGARWVPVGVDTGTDRPEAEVVVPRGATLLLCSDGLVERRGESLDVGMARARAHLGANVAMAPAALTVALTDAQAPPNGYEDDVAVLVYRHPPEPLRIDLPAVPAELAGMRHALRGWLDVAGVGRAVADAVVLATGEAATNAVEHAHDPAPAASITVTAEIDAGRVEILVRDHGHWRPPDADPGDRGRGLDIMRAVMDDVEIVRGAGGTTARMSLGLER